MIKKIIISIIFLLTTSLIFSQEQSNKTEINSSSNALFSGEKGMPFWLHTNKLGKINTSKSSLGLLDLSIHNKQQFKSSKEIALELGANITGSYDGNSALKFFEYWGRFHFKNFYLHAGAKGEEELYNGLSVTNGNILLSNNARPAPRLEFGFDSLKLFNGKTGSRFSFDGLYSEHLLLDDRYIKNPILHHKNLNVTYSVNKNWSVKLGIDNWVYWGGEFPNGNDIPGIEYYFKYVLGQQGGKKSDPSEQKNVAGNHIGQYQLSIKHQRKSGIFNFYLQHIWEDGSGLKFRNFGDGLLGISFQKMDKNNLLNGFLLEFVRTMDQGGKLHQFQPDPDDPDHTIGKGRDNYFGHHIYRSGFTSYGRTVGLPLITPALNEDGTSRGISNNRLWAIHSGLYGQIKNRIFWKTLLTYSRNYGTYGSPNEGGRNKLSAGIDLSWSRAQKPISYFLRFAADMGNYQPNTMGVEFKIAYRFFKVHNK